MRFQIQPLEPPDWSLYFRIAPVPYEPLECQYPRSADALWIESGTPAQIGELAQWYLGLVPPGRRMMLADECVARVVLLTPGMGAAEIARAFDGEWAAPPWAG